MPRRILRRVIPDSQTIRKHRYVSIFGKLLHDPNLWHLNRRSVAGAVAVGLFIAFIPVPFQMAFAAAIAIASRVNLVISVALVWITNPFTIPPVFYTAFVIGNKLLGRNGGDFHFEISWDWLRHSLGAVWEPFLLGCLVLASGSALIGSLAVRGLWRWHVIQDWERRKKARTNKRANRLPISNDPPRQAE